MDGVGEVDDGRSRGQIDDVAFRRKSEHLLGQQLAFDVPQQVAGILDAEQAMLYAIQPDSYVPPRRVPAVIDNADVDAALALAAQDRPPNVVRSTADSGGGAMGGFWLLALAAAALTLPAARSEPRR